MPIKKNLIKNFLYDFFVITTLSIFTFFIFDLIITKLYRVRGHSKFFESNEKAGFINKRGFVGRFGGPLDEFSNKISIDIYGNRKVTSGKCNFSKAKSEYKNLVFVGDSMVAGFEVEDSEHYVSRLSQMCISNGLIINGGVRAHDTHLASANAVRIIKEFDLDHLNTVIIYGFTWNDFYENDNKNRYYNLKARFGSIFDQKNYKPKANLNYLGLRIFMADNFYFTTKFMHYYLNSKNNYDPSKAKIQIKSEKCERVFSILDSTFSAESIESKVLLFVHPHFNKLEKTKFMENCLISAAKYYDQFSILPIHSFMNKKVDKSDYEVLMYKKDPHYTPKGHKFISEKIMPKLGSELINNN